MQGTEPGARKQGRPCKGCDGLTTRKNGRECLFGREKHGAEGVGGDLSRRPPALRARMVKDMTKLPFVSVSNSRSASSHYLGLWQKNQLMIQLAK